MPCEDVTFAIALPPDWSGVDLLSGEADQFLDRPLAEAVASAARGSDHARLLMLRSLVAWTPAREPLVAGLAVTFADRLAPVSAAMLEARAFEQSEVSAITLPVGAGLRVRHVGPASALAGGTSLEVLTIQYFVDTALGLLTMTFTSPQAPRARDWEPLFDAMAGTAKLG
jgi:hypothetical protein